MATHNIYIDSADAASTSSAQFTVTLPENLDLGPNTTYRIDDFRMVHSIPTVTHLNHYIYSLEEHMNVRVIAIPNGYFSAQTLTSVLPAALSVGSHDWGCVYDSGTNTFQVRNSSFSFRFLTDKELSDGTYAPTSWPSDANPQSPKSFNHTLQNYAGSAASTGMMTYTFFADLQPFSYLQLRSKRLSSKNVISCEKRARHSSENPVGRRVGGYHQG